MKSPFLKRITTLMLICVFTFFAFPFVNLLYINFYNDITLYNHYDDNEYENIELQDKIPEFNEFGIIKQEKVIR